MTKFYAKFPNQEFSVRRRGYFATLQAAARHIERRYAPGYTSEPWVQLVREDGEGWKVIAEWRTFGGSGWVSPLKAAGLA